MADSSVVGAEAVRVSPIPFFGVSGMDALSASIVRSKERKDGEKWMRIRRELWQNEKQRKSGRRKGRKVGIHDWSDKDEKERIRSTSIEDTKNEKGG